MDGLKIQELIKARSVVTESGCWEWTSYKMTVGYGRFCFGGKARSAHRESYKAFVDEIPQGYWILHKCDNRACVNPDHLFAGTPKENTADMIAKDRRFDNRKPECVRGHDMTSGYQYEYRRTCKECAKIRSRERYQRRKHAA